MYAALPEGGFMDFKAAIFDLDGTLLDSMGFWDRLDEEFLAKRGVSPVPKTYAHEIAHLGTYETAVYTIKRFGFSETPEQLIAEWTEMALDFYTNRVTLKEGAYEYLEKLHNSGIKLAVATANDETLYLPALKHTGIEKFFSAAAGVREVKRQKGFPDVYLLAAERIGAVPEETAVFEDIYLGIHGAKMGGFKAIAVYDKSSEADTERIKAEADLFIRSFKELL